MSNLAMQHPTDDQLLRFADGELPDARAGEIRNHLRACWQCRSELEEIERTIGECVRYRKIVLEDCMPPPPAPSFDISGASPGLTSLGDAVTWPAASWSHSGRRCATPADGCPQPQLSS